MGVAKLVEVELVVAGGVAVVGHVAQVVLVGGVAEGDVVVLLDDVLQRGSVRPPLDCAPVRLAEEVVRPHLLEGESALGVLLDEAQQQVAEGEAHVPDFGIDSGIDEVVLDGGPVLLQGAFRVFFGLEGILAEHKFKHQHAQ